MSGAGGWQTVQPYGLAPLAMTQGVREPEKPAAEGYQGPGRRGTTVRVRVTRVGVRGVGRPGKGSTGT